MNKELINKLKKLALPTLIGAAALVLDLLTKAWASAKLATGQTEIIKDFFYFRLAHNRGAAFGMLRDLNPDYRVAILLAIAAATIVVMLVVLRPIMQGSALRYSVMAMVIGGALGNMYDRFTQGYVVDFIQFIFFGWPYPTFNMADIWVVVGFILLGYWMLKHEANAPAKTDKNKDPIQSQVISEQENTAPSKPKRGFTLLEVMIAMAILSMSLVVILESHSHSMQMTNSIKYITIATQLARYQMIETQVEIFEKGFSAFDERLEGNFEELGYPNFRWEALVKKPTLALDASTLGLSALGLDFGLDPEEAGDTADDLLGSFMGGGSGLGIAPEGGGGLMTNMMNSYAQMYIKEIEEAIRYLSLTVYWTEGRREKSFTVTTHIVNMPGASPRPPMLRDVSTLTPEQLEAVQKMTGGQPLPSGMGAPATRPPAGARPSLPPTTPVQRGKLPNIPGLP